MIFRVKPMRSITFDPGLPLLNLVDEYDDVSAHNRDQRAAELARLEGMPPLGIPFKHLVQSRPNHRRRCREALRHLAAPRDLASQRQRRCRAAWPMPSTGCSISAPRRYACACTKSSRTQVAHLTPGQRQALGILGQRLRPEMDGDTIHALVYALAEEVGLPAKALFEAIYIALLDQPRGPRVGWFLSSLEYDFVQTRLHDAAALEG